MLNGGESASTMETLSNIWWRRWRWRWDDGWYGMLAGRRNSAGGKLVLSNSIWFIAPPFSLSLSLSLELTYTSPLDVPRKASCLPDGPYRRNFSLYPGFQIVIGSPKRNRRKAPSLPPSPSPSRSSIMMMKERQRLKESGSNRLSVAA